MKQAISLAKVFFFILTVIASLAFAYFFHGKYHNNTNAVTVIAAAFSILSGFLMAILGIAWDERLIRSRSWRASVVELQLIKQDINKHRLMFYLYLLVLAFAFFSALDFKVEWIDSGLDIVVLFLSCFALIYSFRLPGYLMRRNLSELDRIIRERARQETASRPEERG